MLSAAVSFSALLLAQGPSGPNDSVKAAKLVERARKEELELFTDWRKAWIGLRDLNSSGSRFWSLHCHFDEIGGRDNARHLIHSRESRKSMCPVWFQHGGTRADESTGIDNPLSDKARRRVRERRARVLQLLDSAQLLAPGDSWVLGQRVRLSVDQGLFDRAAALATSECRDTAVACALLAGYALASGGEWKAATAAFDHARRAMTQTERCTQLDIALFLDERTRDRYEKLPCPARDSIADRFWWLSDPLFSQPGNERLTVHLYRQTLVALRSALIMDEHFDWRPSYGATAARELLVRYGPPSVAYFNAQEHEAHNGWLGFAYRPANSSHEYFTPRYHTTPPYDVASGARPLERGDLADLGAAWDAKNQKLDEDWWPLEHFARAGALSAMDVQAAAFRREHAPLVVVAADPGSRDIADSTLSSYTAMLFAGRGPGDTLRQSSANAHLRAGGGMSMSLEARPGQSVLSAEVVNPQRDSAPAARARWSASLPAGLDALKARELALSESALFEPPATDAELPRSLADAMERMLPTTTLRSPRVGVFVELYGLAPSDSVELTLTVVSEERAGLLRRLANRLGITEADGLSFVVRWRESQPGTAASATTIGGVPVQSRAIVLNLGALDPGKYQLVVGASRPGEAVVMSSRDVVVQR
ncbi:MAG TPA: hypothetical protein VFT29_04755 [Gemmatimonadaceae bacterium]|nr:hypothetical protein [Gemmatimonadaceae bacterium]